MNGASFAPYGRHRSLFVDELDGETFRTLADAQRASWEADTVADEIRAEGAWLRAAENNPSVWEEEFLNPFLNDPAVGLVSPGW
ncbi:hypothetical protein [Kitasatospora griseola]|uniref:hypothetical protein n=1 Tax=Kitasatospora griseola TaxID=2064 RepID=UPI00342C6E23